MRDPAHRRATYRDVLASPPNVVAEVVAGELSLSPRPATPHAAATSALGAEVAPDWACEALSPSTAALDRTKKRPVYAREGVSWLWFVDGLADARGLRARPRHV